MKMNMNMERHWDDTERGRVKYSEKTRTGPICQPQISHRLARDGAMTDCRSNNLCTKLEFLPYREHSLHTLYGTLG